MLSLLTLLLIFICSAEAGWVSKEQYKRLIKKEVYLTKTVKELGLPKETVDIFLGMYLRESSIGKYSVGDKEKDAYYYMHQNKKVYVTERVYNKAKYLKNKHVKFLTAEYWGRKWIKILHVEVGEIKPISEASLGDYNITFGAIVETIRILELEEYYWLLNHDKTKVVHKLKLVNMVLNNHEFNTYMALSYFKLTYNEAVRRKMSNPIKRAISRHNGGWNNNTYIKQIDKDITYVRNAIKKNRWNINKKEYLESL